MIPGKRIALWALERHDILAVYKWVNDPEIVRSAIEWYFPLSLEDVENWYVTVSTNPSIKVFSIKTLEGNFIGVIELSDIDWRSRKADVGIILGEKDFWNQGYGEEAMELIINFAFNDLNLNRLSATVLATNERSLNIFKKLGFKEEGRLRKAVYQNGDYTDLIVLGLLKEEWGSQA